MPYDAPSPMPHSDTLQVPPITLPLVSGLVTRGISAETCDLYRCYSDGVPGQMVTAFGVGAITGWKYRKGGWLPTSTPKQTWWAPGSKRSLFGLHLWDGEPCDVYLCEGETDAMRLFELLGGNDLVLALAGNPGDEQFSEWLTAIALEIVGEGHTLYLAFDNDEPGETYTRFVSRNYRKPHYGLRIAPHKDVCEWADATPNAELYWEGLPRIPPNIRRMTDVVSELRTKPSPLTPGLSTGIAELDRLTTGYYPGSFLMLAAPGKQGKSALANDLVVKYVRLHKQRVLMVPLELTDEETTLLVGADVANVQLYDSNTSGDDVLAGCDEVSDYIYMVRHFGQISVTQLEDFFDACATLDISLIVIDHITAAATSNVDGMQTSQLDAMLYLIKAKLNQLQMSCICVTHVNNSEHENVTVNSLRGSRALSQVPTSIFGLVRTDDEAARLYTVLPDRRTGREGKIEMRYDNGNYSSVHEVGGKLL